MKEDCALMLLSIMQRILQTISKTNEVRVEGWTESDSKTLKIMIEVRVGKRIPYAPSLY